MGCARLSTHGSITVTSCGCTIQMAGPKHIKLKKLALGSDYWDARVSPLCWLRISKLLFCWRTLIEQRKKFPFPFKLSRLGDWTVAVWREPGILETLLESPLQRISFFRSSIIILTDWIFCSRQGRSDTKWNNPGSQRLDKTRDGK